MFLSEIVQGIWIMYKQYNYGFHDCKNDLESFFNDPANRKRK